jgi:hypothetical protein
MAKLARAIDGRVAANMARTRPLAERFNEKVDRGGGPDACWLWTAHRHQGYGVIKVLGRLRKAHHVAWELHHDQPLPALMYPRSNTVVRHSCDNPPCCNPAHLHRSTQVANIRDMNRKGRRRGGPQPPRNRFGEANPFCRVSDANVTLIRHSAECARVLAERYGLSRSHVYKIKWGLARTGPPQQEGGGVVTTSPQTA